MRVAPYILPIILGSLALAAPLAAQDAPAKPGAADAHAAPALPEPLARFAPMLGHWSGRGTVRMDPSAPAMEWTSRSTTKAVLGDRFIQTDMRLEFGGAMPAMVHRTYYGYDASRGELVHYALGSNGELEVSGQVTWAGDSILVILAIDEEQGTPIIHRSVITVAPEEHTYLWEAAVGSKPFSTMVEGKLERSATPYEISAAEWEAPFMPGATPAAMQRLGRMAGDYTMNGEFRMTPGAPPFPISGRETIRPVFGGAALHMHVIGDRVPGGPDFIYEGHAFIAWDPARECYREFFLNNMGETGVQELRFVDETRLVTTMSRLQEGTPEATRGTVQLDETGAIVKVSMDRMSAGDEPERMFLGNYAKVGEKKPE